MTSEAMRSTDELGLGLRESFATKFTAMSCYDNGTFYDLMRDLSEIRSNEWHIQSDSYGRWGGCIPTRDLATAIQLSVAGW